MFSRAKAENSRLPPPPVMGLSNKSKAFRSASPYAPRLQAPAAPALRAAARPT